jgi:glucose/arabinose dehydrogenase
VASHGKISVLRDSTGHGRADQIHDIVTNLPTRLYDWHSNNGLAFGPDGRLYFPVGSTSDSSPETHKYAASILSVNPDGSDLRVFATGVRNPFALAFNSRGDLFATDNGPDTFTETPPDELNQIVEGADYGFSKYFGVPPVGSATRGPIALFPPHASADGIAIYDAAQFPAEYKDNAFVVSFHRGEVYRVQLVKSPSGDYLTNTSMFANGLDEPLDITVGPDGGLYIADWGDSAIYRVGYAATNTYVH